MEITSSDEYQYLKGISEILSNGRITKNRTGVDTKTVYGLTMKYKLDDSFPLFTTKSMFWRGIVEELLWFISGSTNTNILKNKGIHIWDENGSLKYIKKRGFNDRKEGDLGPVYGFQWRHFGAKYIDMDTNYTNQGFDQLTHIINKIKNKPESRNIILTAWNPIDVENMVIPPCHCFVQFHVINNKYLTCQMYQRSADMGLGVPFNVASYSLLTYMIAHLTNLKPYEFIHNIGNAHIYVNHINGLKKQLERTPNPFPKLKIKRQVDNIDDFKFDDFELIDYNHLGKIKLDMVV
ncbi:ORF MSV238 putative thymidylate synthase, similar to Arabidopsis thaliana GB:L08594 [Melanoplus sanguinipes entomopoxvirus]|uniref:thymidylate synthase n=1 Tax=Melanoplus sanguinipes entomopoxvirus TaxID=83191 RepID=Q9YVK4_MSEPV|nr:ORF MSV238 putative thymidylate synthase, similar to Arabidopsis thaliana GB:L08594 [Melanoplus sanguinipes entomopoxvirus]AAC97742.1 ORF MSV238 putative thymidylate synthase, similar to Arabidopsis thaliana GB:L08594 [Melanoplus sanguinipes entomopoxvirus 'O']